MAQILEVGSNIGIPGPPTGPSYLTTTMSELDKSLGEVSKNLSSAFHHQDSSFTCKNVIFQSTFNTS